MKRLFELRFHPALRILGNVLQAAFCVLFVYWGFTDPTFHGAWLWFGVIGFALGFLSGWRGVWLAVRDWRTGAYSEGG